MLVDLFTYDREFDSIILEEFPGFIFEEQHKIDASKPGQKRFRFDDLDYSDLHRFLPKYRSRFEFELRDNKTGEIIEINRLDRYLN